jgi:two-component system nitrogen regulation sensor histidine kinase NtrY
MNEIRKPTEPLDPTADPAKPSAGGRRTVHHAERRAVERTTSGARAPFRSRLFAILLLFAIVPSVVLTLAWVITTSRTLPLVGATSAWERVGASGERAITTLADAPLNAAQREALETHEAELRRSIEMAKRFGCVVPRTVRLIALGAFVLLIGVTLGASRVAGHLARQLSRPLDELVGWTGLIRSGAPLPDVARRRGAPEFEVLRTGMRTMAAELEQGRAQALAAERDEAFRESARRFAHELKNPLTPIRFAVARLRRSAPPELHDTVEVLAEESSRLDAMARSFAQFGRLPDGPPADVDLGDLVSRTAQSIVPERLTLALDIDTQTPLVQGFHEALVRAVSNVLINAVEVSPDGGTITASVRPDQLGSEPAVRIAIGDTGPGIPTEQLARIFDPYVTTKPGGTGLGLAIARQTISAHRGVVEAESTPGRGTQIRFRIPLRGLPRRGDPSSSGAFA